MVIKDSGQSSQRAAYHGGKQIQLRHVTPGGKARTVEALTHFLHRGPRPSRWLQNCLMHSADSADMDRVQQVRGMVEALLQPSQELFSDGVGAPTQPDTIDLHDLHRHEATVLASLEQLENHLSDLIKQGRSLLPVTEPEGQPQRKGPLIEEISAVHADASVEKLLQRQLVANSCLVAALYAVDPALLTPWTTHQLDLASRKLLHTICAACMPAASEANYTNATKDSEQNTLLPMFPLLLPQLQAVLVQNFNRHDHLQSSKQSGLVPHG